MKKLRLNTRARVVVYALLEKPLLRREQLFEMLHGAGELDTKQLWARFNYLRRKLATAGVEITVEHGRGIYLSEPMREKLRELA